MPLKLKSIKIQFILLIPMVAVSLKWLGVQSTTKLFCGLKKVKNNQEVDDIANARVVLRVLKQTVQELKFNGNCLSRSIVLHRLLRNRGISSKIEIGVAKINDEFKAHAWVEHKGIPLNAGQEVRVRYKTVEGYGETDNLEF